MPSREYAAWVAGVRANGGRVVQSATGAINPNTGQRGIPSVLSAAYPASVWGPRANAKTWPLPNEYSVNGVTGYYHAHPLLVAEAQRFQVATTGETSAGATALLDRWGIPSMFRSFGAYGRTLAMMAVVVGVAYYMVTRRARGSHAAQ